MISTTVIEALKVATLAHKGQLRKYNGDPYIIHPIRVLRKVVDYYNDIKTYPHSHHYCSRILTTQEVYIVTVLHDVIEDTDFPAEEIERLFGKEVLNGVISLTNPSKQHPQLKRWERKKMDREHIASLEKCLQIIKLKDREDNLKDLKDAKDDFKKIYIDETITLVDALLYADKIVKVEVLNACDDLSKTIEL